MKRKTFSSAAVRICRSCDNTNSVLTEVEVKLTVVTADNGVLSASPRVIESRTATPLSGKVLKEDTLECFSRNHALYRLILTDAEIYIQSIKHPDQIEHYSLDDLFGVQTYRHKQAGSSRFNSAFICFTFYFRANRCVITSSKFREKTQVVFEIQKTGFTFPENLEVASGWKSTCLLLLRNKFPKWQLEKLIRQNQSPESPQDARTPSEDFSDKGNGEGVEVLGDNNGNNEVDGGATNELAVSLSNETLLLRKFVVILNPKSGQGKTLSIFKNAVHPILREAGIKAVLLVTEHAGHARSMVSTEDLSDFHGIVTVGGDGLLYEVVNGIRSRADFKNYTDIPVGAIAGGSGNGLARSIASYSGESEDYIKNPVLETTLAVARGRVIPVNLMEVDVDSRKVFAFLSVGWGILADIDIESEVIRAIGEIRFTLWSLLRLVKLRSYPAKIEYSVKPSGDGSNDEGIRVVEGNFVSVYASCQSHIGSDIIFAREATPNDGILHLTFARGDIGRARVTQFLLGLDKGSHIDVPGVEYVKVEEFSIYYNGGISGTLTLDGEKVEAERLRVKLAPEPLNVFAL